MMQLGDAASPRRPASEFEVIFTVWRNNSKYLNKIPSGTAQSAVPEKD